MSDLDPEFLELEDVFELHADSIARYGGDMGVRDRGLIDAAVAVTRQSFGGEYLRSRLGPWTSAGWPGCSRSVRSQFPTNQPDPQGKDRSAT